MRGDEDGEGEEEALEGELKNAESRLTLWLLGSLAGVTMTAVTSLVTSSITSSITDER